MYVSFAYYYFKFLLENYKKYLFSGEIPDENPVDDGPVPWCKRNQLTFLAEQVSHHPPSKCFFCNKN